MQPILFIISLVLLSNSPGQRPETPSRYEQRALDILENSRALLNSFDSFHAEFEYDSSAAGFGQRLNDSGSLYTKGDKYHMRLDGNIFISDGITVWSFMEDINEVHISNFYETEGIITPTSLLDNYQETFRPLWIRQELHRGKDVHVIDLVPEDPHTPFSKYRIALEAESGMVAYVVAYDRQGGTYSYIIKETTTNPDLPDTLFSFNPDDYPGIEVVDLR